MSRTPQLIVALDHSAPDDALALVQGLAGEVDFYKVGAPLFIRGGPAFLAALRAERKRIFLDLKYHDIPNTVGRSVRAAAELEVDMITLHVTGGPAMMQAAREACPPGGPRLLGVTILTSLAAADLEEVWAKELRSLREEVERLAALAARNQLDGVVASVREAEILRRRLGPDFLLVTPAVRLAGGPAGDQARTATPAEAARAGVDYIVVGRPIIDAAEPLEVVAEIRAQLTGEPAGHA